ncbi:MAG: hypothetical protein ACI8UO_000038 [Verrucomicrobiales bacterium]|jgi:hypothetical protein
MRWLTLILLISVVSGYAGEFSNSFWVWHRDHKLSEREIKTLESGGVSRVFWHVGSWEWLGGDQTFSGSEPPENAAGDEIEVVPVLRIEAGAEQVESKEARASFLKLATNFVAKTKPSALQIDYDCPDRLLPVYQQLLAELRTAIAPTELSATALAGWARLDSISGFKGSVDWLAPMFYDLWPDEAVDVLAGKIRPLADPEATELIEAWTACPVPWEAGLANFARVTLFAEDGKSKGHFPNWPWDAVSFHPALQIVGEPSPGVTLLRATQPLVIRSVEINSDSLLAARIPDRDVLAQQREQSQKSGARGVIWFRLPGTKVPTGLTSSDVLALGSEEEIEINLDFQNPKFNLKNSGVRDLPLRISGRHGDQDRGYQLEIDASAVARFDEAGAGDFVLVRGHIEPDSDEPIPVRIPSATRLTFWLSHLSAGDELESGFVSLKRGSTVSDLRWRLDGGDWRKFSEMSDEDPP